MWADDTWFSSLPLIGILQCGPLSQWAGVYKADKCGNLGMSLSEVSRGKALKAQTHTHNPSITGTSADTSSFRFYQLFEDDRTPSFASVWKVYKKVHEMTLGLQAHACHQLLVHSPGHGSHQGPPQRTRYRPPKEPAQAMFLKKKERKWFYLNKSVT